MFTHSELDGLLQNEHDAVAILDDDKLLDNLFPDHFIVGEDSAVAPGTEARLPGKKYDYETMLDKLVEGKLYDDKAKKWNNCPVLTSMSFGPV
jgi:hypothetical protein